MIMQGVQPRPNLEGGEGEVEGGRGKGERRGGGKPG